VNPQLLRLLSSHILVSYWPQLNLNHIQVTKILYHWVLFLHWFRFWELHFATYQRFVADQIVISPSLGGFLIALQIWTHLQMQIPLRSAVRFSRESPDHLNTAHLLYAFLLNWSASCVAALQKTKNHLLLANTALVQCVAVCWSMLHCIAVCAVCCSVLQCVAVCCSVLQCLAVSCGVLQCVAVCRGVLNVDHTATPFWRCNVLQNAATYCNTLQHTVHTAIHHNTIYYNTLQHTAPVLYLLAKDDFWFLVTVRISPLLCVAMCCSATEERIAVSRSTTTHGITQYVQQHFGRQHIATHSFWVGTCISPLIPFPKAFCLKKVHLTFRIFVCHIHFFLLLVAVL